MNIQSESVSWKSHAADTLAKRNQMLSSLRVGAGLPHAAQSTAKLDTAAYSVRGFSPSQSVFNTDPSSATSFVSPLPSQDTPFHESVYGSNFGDRMGSVSPAALKAMPPKRVQPSRHQQLHQLLPPRVATGSNQFFRQDSQSLPSLLRTSFQAHTAENVPLASQPVPPDSLLTSFSTVAGKSEENETLQPWNAASTSSNPGHTPLRIPSRNPFLPDPVKVKSPHAEMVFEDSDGSQDDASTSRDAIIPELTAEEQLQVEVLQEQLGHLVEAGKSKKLTGPVKIEHAINALRLAVHLHVSRARIDSTLPHLQTVLYKLAWDYHQYFFEAEHFDVLLDICVDDRCTEGSKLALQVLLVLFERDARVNGGSVRVELFESLKDAITMCLSSENDEFRLGWGLWFLSYFATHQNLAILLFQCFPLEQMLQMLTAHGTQLTTKYKIMQALRNLSAGCFEIHSELFRNQSFIPWLMRSCAKKSLNPTVEVRMLHVQMLGVIWNLCSSPESAAKMLMHGVYDALLMVLEMPYSDTQEIALLALADIASTEHGRLRLLDSRLAVSLCGLAKSIPLPPAGVFEGIMRILFALSETEKIKNKQNKSGHTPYSSREVRASANAGLEKDENFFRIMGVIDVVGHLLRNGGEVTKLLALGTLINLCHFSKNIPTIQRLVAPDVEHIANSLISPPPLKERAQALTLVLNDRSRNACGLM